MCLSSAWLWVFWSWQHSLCLVSESLPVACPRTYGHYPARGCGSTLARLRAHLVSCSDTCFVCCRTCRSDSDHRERRTHGIWTTFHGGMKNPKPATHAKTCTFYVFTTSCATLVGQDLAKTLNQQISAPVHRQEYVMEFLYLQYLTSGKCQNQMRKLQLCIVKGCTFLCWLHYAVLGGQHVFHFLHEVAPLPWVHISRNRIPTAKLILA